MKWSYEMTPEELIRALREPCQYENCVLCQQAADAIEKLAAYEDAEEQRRLVILPKTLYEADPTPLITGVTEWEVTGVRYYDGNVQAYTVRTKNVQTIIYGSEIGKTVFLTHEEAEAALKRLKGETNDV